MTNLRDDLRFALRMLRRNPWFSLVAVMTLALAIGGNAAIFSIADSVLLRPLPYASPQDIYTVAWRTVAGDEGGVTGRDAEFLLGNAHSFDSVAMVTGAIDTGSSLLVNNRSHYIKTLEVSAGYFRVLGTSASKGRTFDQNETHLGGPHAVVLSDAIWHAAFNGDPDILGREIHINGKSFLVTGVLPAGFQSFPEADLYQSLQLDPKDPNYGGENYDFIARLKPGVTAAQAQQELTALSAAVRPEYPYRGHSRPEFRYLLRNYHDELIGDVRPGVLVLELSVGFVLMVACLNLAALLLARSSQRAREIAIRTALGASRMRIVRLLFGEALMLSCVGGVLGFWLARIAVPALLNSSPVHLPSGWRVAVDGRIALFTFGLALVAAGIFGLAPVTRLLRSSARASLHGESRKTVSSLSQRNTSRVLAISQTAIALILLSGAALLITTLVRIASVPPGFDPKGVVAAQVSLAGARYVDEKGAGMATAQLARPVLERIRSLPGVEAAGYASAVPLIRGLNLGGFPAEDPKKVRSLEYRAVGGDYFRALGIPVLEGREFLGEEAAPVAIINQRLARIWWPGESAVGHTVGSGNSRYQVVGVVGDAHDRTLDRPAQPMIILPISQASAGAVSYNNRFFLNAFVVRGSADATALRTAIEDAVHGQDPSVPVVSVRPMTEVLEASLNQPRFYASLMGSFAGFAVLLAAIGLFGLLSYDVVQRTAEIGIRMALGAQRVQVLFMFLKQGVMAALAGIALGTIGALALTRYLQSFLYQVKPNSPSILFAVAFGIALVALLASYLPAWRATRVDPIEALRYE